MTTPMQANARHGDESKAAHRRNRTIWIWAIVAVLAIIALIAVMSRTSTGPASNTGRVASETSNVQGGVAPGVGSTYAGQAGGTPGGTPKPNSNAVP